MQVLHASSALPSALIPLSPGLGAELREREHAVGPGGERPPAPAAEPHLRALAAVPLPHDVVVPAPRAPVRIAVPSPRGLLEHGRLQRGDQRLLLLARELERPL
jgi:hypothetical protein